MARSKLNSEQKNDIKDSKRRWHQSWKVYAYQYQGWKLSQTERVKTSERSTIERDGFINHDKKFKNDEVCKRKRLTQFYQIV